MRTKLARVLVAVVALVLLSFMLLSSTLSRRSTDDVAQDTMCLASRIGLPCSPD
ncbi:MAG TPA: hypothetical protein VJ802_14825 [Gemmatimonadaceae bacterium]|nr:hypothetical protein [Gemmatimonadaceae bacterium]